MTLVNFKTRPISKDFNNFTGDYLSHFPSLLKSDLFFSKTDQTVPVNIKEAELFYKLEVIAPGFSKEDFQISLEKNLLTISVEKKSEEETKSEKHIRNEYEFEPFKRSFTVDEKIDINSIAAEYVNGVLTLNLPKKEKVITAKQIVIN